MLLDWLGNWPGATFLQRSGTAYLFVNAAHILGIGLLVGAILPLDLRLAGLLRGPPLADLGPFLSRVARLGLAIAIVTGLWLFTVKPAEYLRNAAFGTKMALLALALVNIALQHRSAQFRVGLSEPASTRVRILAAASAMLWLSVLIAGRWIGFV